MPLQATSGAASYDAFGGGVPVVPNYIEGVFSTWLYTGNGSTQTITNGIDLSTNGGLVWIKTRNIGANHQLFDTNRGVYKRLASNTTGSEFNYSPSGLTSFNTNGFTLSGSGEYNLNGYTQVGWTFRQQPKFFDVVTYTAGSGPTSAISHNLGVVPGCIIMKSTSNAESWLVVHRGTNGYLFLNLTDARDGVSLAGIGANTSVAWVGATSTTIDFSNFWGTGSSYVAYLFAHNAGGFGLTGTDNVISCGSYTGNGGDSNPITLGYEPQWIMIKNASNAWDWAMFDNMRGVTANQYNGAKELVPNASSQESTSSRMQFNATGFNPVNGQGVQNASGDTYIYIAIRRGPMKVPTDGTEVFLPSTYTGSNSVNQVVNTGFTVDMTWARARNAANSMEDYDRLRGNTVRLSTDSTDAEISSTALYFDLSNSVSLRAGYNLNYSTLNFIAYNFSRAPGFMDVCCYTGTGAERTVAHNLGVAPEMIIVKSRGTDFTNWIVYHSSMGNTYYENLNYDFAKSGPSADVWSSTNPSSSVFSTGNFNNTNGSGRTFVACLFASCAGVSKVGSYTGTGTTQQINCGFTAGSRFVLIKRTDSDGDWYVWDSARGIVAGNDPYLLLNSTAIEVTSTDYVDTYSAGFEISSTAPAAINASGGTFIFLTIA